MCVVGAVKSTVTIGNRSNFVNQFCSHNFGPDDVFLIGKAESARHSGIKPSGWNYSPSDLSMLPLTIYPRQPKIICAKLGIGLVPRHTPGIALASRHGTDQVIRDWNQNSGLSKAIHLFRAVFLIRSLPSRSPRTSWFAP